MEKTINKVSIRMVNDIPLVSEEILDTPQKAAQAVGQFIKDMEREAFCVINFNSKLQPINFSVVSIGTVNSTLAVPRDVLKSAILSNATYMMIMHNHPSSILKPSTDDIKMTSRFIDTCELMGMPLLDHIIVGPKTNDYFSMKEKNTVSFKSSIKYADNLEFLNFKTGDEVKVAEKNNRLAR